MLSDDMASLSLRGAEEQTCAKAPKRGNTTKDKFQCRIQLHSCCVNHCSVAGLFSFPAGAS